MNKKLLDAMKNEQPLQVVGTINAYSSLLAKKAGFKAIYLLSLSQPLQNTYL